MQKPLLLSALVLAGCSLVSKAAAQTWSNARGQPTLFQIISVDPCGEDGWPYGQEDPAGDGIDTLRMDEAAVDLRTVYADADGGRLWLRAYATGRNAPSDTAVAFFFVDVDDDRNTGGPANDTAIFSAFDLDPTPGGYEYAFGVDGSGTLTDVYAYSARADAWTVENGTGNDVRGEVGTDRDPIDLNNEGRTYFQIDVAHGVTGLNASCEARVFVRAYNDDEPDRDFGDDDDDDDGFATCRPDLNALGDPAVLETDACSVDADCPAGGRCEGGICIIDYSCRSDSDCRSDQTCRDGRCVVVVDRACTGNADCDGLVCDGGRCIACSDGGAIACADGFVCSSLGSCVEAGGTGGGGPSGGPDVVDTDGGVRGGAFKCSVGVGGAAARSAWLWMLAALGLVLRRVNRIGRDTRGEGRVLR